jgi:hypothetical protein
MTLFEIYTLIRFIVNKDFEGNIITPERFKELIKVVNIDLFRKKYGLPEEYQPGRPVPNEHVDITLKNTDDLKAFRMSILNAPVISGVLVYPLDYAHRDELVYNFTKTINGKATILPRGVEILRESQISERRGNYTKQPSTKNPCGVMRLSGIHIYPITITSVDFYYFRFPRDPVFSYVQHDGYITYDTTNSTELEWTKDEKITFTRMVLQYIGVNLREGDIVQYSQMKLQGG